MTATAYDHSAPKRSANLSVNEDLLRQAKALNINLSQAFEHKLEELVREAKARQWLEENRDAISAYNQWVEKDGLWSDGLRLF